MHIYIHRVSAVIFSTMTCFYPVIAVCRGSKMPGAVDAITVGANPISR